MNNTTTRFLYLIQGCVARKAFIEDLQVTDHVVVFSYGEEAMGFKREIRLPPDATWAAGRNIMADHARLVKDHYDYVVFMDDDVLIDHDEFERQVLKSGKGLVWPNYYRYLDCNIDQIFSGYELMDQCYFAVATDKLQHIHYDTTFDSTNWHATGPIMMAYLYTFCKPDMDIVSTICTNRHLTTKNKPTYPRITRHKNKELDRHIESLGYLPLNKRTS